MTVKQVIPNRMRRGMMVAGDEQSSSVAPDDPDVRETFSRLPFQVFWTWLSGKPAFGESAPWKPSAWTHLSTAIGSLLAGVVLSTWIVSTGSLALLPGLLISWLMTVHGARVLQVTIMHHAVHKNFSRNPRVDRILSEAISAALIIQDFQAYRKDHVGTHHTKHIATIDDPDLKFILALGFRPGMTRRELWRRLALTPFSIRFHRLFLSARIRANFGRDISLPRRFASAALCAILLTPVLLTGTWLELLFSWVFPMTVLYHVSALLQFMSEHKWLRVDMPGETRKLTLARLTAGRFMGEPAPIIKSRGLAAILAWARWLSRMAVIHLPARVFVIVSDLPAHDWHHRHAYHDWTAAAYERQRDLEAGCPGWPEVYTEVWGLRNAIDAVFRLWSELPPLDVPTSISPEEARSVLNGM